MKTHIQNLAMMSAVIAFASCNSYNQEQQAEKVTPTTTETDTAQAPPIEAPANEMKTIEGVVKSMVPGKDGYTAEIETKEGIYKATISRANLNDPKQYRNFNTSEIVKLSGEFWTMEQEKQLTVREIQ